jgi:hypothetical protein
MLSLHRPQVKPALPRKVRANKIHPDEWQYYQPEDAKRRALLAVIARGGKIILDQAGYRMLAQAGFTRREVHLFSGYLFQIGNLWIEERDGRVVLVDVPPGAGGMK